MAPMTGLAIVGNGPRRHVAAAAGAEVAGACEPSSLRSRPAQNAGSAPVRITHVDVVAAVGLAHAAAGSRRSTSLDSALRASGRLSVMVAMRSLTSSSTTVGHGMPLGCYGSSSGGQVVELEVAEAHERRRDPAAERAEVLVEQPARAVGERLLGQLVEALVGDLDGELRPAAAGRRRRRSRPSAPARSSALVADRRARRGQHGQERRPARAGRPGAGRGSTISISMRGRLVEHLVDVPAPVGGLAPRRPVEGDVGHDPGRQALAGQAVARLPRHVAEEHVDLEVLLERLALEEGGLERLAERGDGVGEDMVEHRRAQATGPGPTSPRRASAPQRRYTAREQGVEYELARTGAPGAGRSGHRRAAEEVRCAGRPRPARLIFILQNLDTISVKFLWFDFRAQLWLLLVIFACIGAAVFWGIARRRAARKAKAAE